MKTQRTISHCDVKCQNVRSFFIESLCMIVVLLLAFAWTARAAESESNLVFILDASGSMWQQIDGVARITIAKEVLTDLIQDLPDGVNVGLVAYGHRTKGDCHDVEELVPLGILDKQQLSKTINAVNPIGKTPITLSIQLTAEKLKTLEEETTILLVSDGKETCEGDPCKLVKALKESGVKFIMHVIGFDVNEEEKQQLECIAQAGGGLYHTAKNAKEFSMAAKNVVAQTKVESEPLKSKKNLGYLKIDAEKNGKPCVAWVKVIQSETGEPVADSDTSADNPTTIEVEPGTYNVEVTDETDQTIRLSGVDIPANQTVEKSVQFGSGFLKIG